MSYKEMIPNCFGEFDQKFALHSNEVEWARKVLVSAINSGVRSWSEFEKEFKDHLEKQNIHESLKKKHIQEQLKNLRDLSSYFTED